MLTQLYLSWQSKTDRYLGRCDQLTAVTSTYMAVKIMIRAHVESGPASEADIPGRCKRSRFIKHFVNSIRVDWFH